jgi:YidC/Oxa1 family membrane protein insertase
MNIPLLTPAIGWILKFCYDLVNNYALALLIFTFLMNLILFPFGIIQQKNSLRQAKLRPKEMAIRNRYAGRDDKVTQQKMQQEVMKLYQDENYNPASGCLPMILQLVIIFSLYGVIQAPLTHVSDFKDDEIKDMGYAVVQLYKEGNLNTEGISNNHVKLIKAQADKLKVTETDGVKTYNFDEVKNPLSGSLEVFLVRIVRENVDEINKTEFFAEDHISGKELPNFFLTGKSLDLSRSPDFKVNGENWWLMLIPVLTFLFTFASMKINKKLTYQPVVQQNNDMGCSMKLMDYMMPLMSTFITFSVPAVIAVYWIYNNVISTLKQFILKLMFPIPQFTDEDYKNAEREMNKGIKQVKKKNTGKRAAHRIDLADNDSVIDTTATETKDEADAKPEKKSKAHDLIAPASVKDESDKNTD